MDLFRRPPAGNVTVAGRGGVIGHPRSVDGIARGLRPKFNGFPLPASAGTGFAGMTA